MSMERPCGSVSRTNSDTRWSNGSSGSSSWNPRSRSARAKAVRTKTTSTSICCRTSERRHRIRCSVDIQAADRFARSGRPAGPSASAQASQGSVLVVKDDGQERLIDLESAVVLDEAQLLELVHEDV